MKVAKSIESKYIIAYDIETVRMVENYDDVPEDMQVAWSYKNKKDGVILDYQDLSELWVTNSALFAEFSKVCAVSLVFLASDESTLMCKSIKGEDEAQILATLSTFLSRISTASPKYRMLGFASNFFDNPFLCKRYIINRMIIPTILDVTDKKPWEHTNLDANTMWKCGGSGPGSSLVALCCALGLELSKGDMAGDEVGKAYYEGKLEDISYYCDKDTIATFNVFQVFNNRKTYLFSEVVKVEEVSGQEEIQMDPLKNLYLTKEFTDDIKEDITKRFLSKKKVLKKEWSMLRKLLIDLYVENKMFKSDTKKVAEAKRKEVEEFVSQLQNKTK